MTITKIINNFFSSPEVLKYYSHPHFKKPEIFLIKKFFKKKGKILDICCGGGRVMFMLSQLGFEVIGVDNNKSMIYAAKQETKKKHYSNIKFFLKDASEFIFKKNYFDYALLLDNSIEHIPSKAKRLKILQNIYFSLKKDGLLIISLTSPFELKTFFKILFFRGDEFGDCIQRINVANKQFFLFYHYFFPWERKYFEKIGFRILEIFPLNLFDTSKNHFSNPNFYKFFHNLFYCYYVLQKV